MTLILATLDAVVASLAANHGFQSFTGGTIGQTNRIYRDVLPPPASDEYTPEEMAAYRPFCQLWVAESSGWQTVRVASSNCFRAGGLIIMRFEWETPDNTTEAAASRLFLDKIGNILTNDNGTGLLQDSDRINTNKIRLAGWARADEKAAAQYGDAYMAELELYWGMTQ